MTYEDGKIRKGATPMERLKRLFVAVGTVAALTLGFSPAAHAGDLGSSVQLGNTATLGANGSTVTVPVTVTCPSAQQANLNVSLSQVHGKSLIQASGYEFITCTGSAQLINVSVSTLSGTKFRHGPALAEAGLYSYYSWPDYFGSLDTRPVTLN